MSLKPYARQVPALAAGYTLRGPWRDLFSLFFAPGRAFYPRGGPFGRFFWRFFSRLVFSLFFFSFLGARGCQNRGFEGARDTLNTNSAREGHQNSQNSLFLFFATLGPVLGLFWLPLGSLLASFWGPLGSLRLPLAPLGAKKGPKRRKSEPKNEVRNRAWRPRGPKGGQGRPKTSKMEPRRSKMDQKE